jgi:hypothetical protein
LAVPVAEVARVADLARRSTYGKPNRIDGSLIHGSLMLAHLRRLAGRPLRCLFIGYGQDTYDAQLAANLGHSIQADFVDILDHEPDDPRWAALTSTNGVLAWRYHQQDARLLRQAFAGQTFDFISVARGSLDLMPAGDYLAAVGGCRDLLGEGGLAIVPASMAQFTPRVMAAARLRLWLGLEQTGSHPSYTSKLGTFDLSPYEHARFVDEFWASHGFDAADVVQRQLELFARQEPAACELADLAKAEANPGWLEAMSTCGGRFGRVLRLADMPGPAQVGAFDILQHPRDERGRWAFVVRATLLLRGAAMPEPPEAT